MLILNIIQIVLLVLLSLATLYILIFSIAYFINSSTILTTEILKRMAVLVLVIRKMKIIKQHALEQEYPTRF
jgi:hypothetical protein